MGIELNEKMPIIKAFSLLNPQIDNSGIYSEEDDDDENEFKEDNFEESSDGVTLSK